MSDSQSPEIIARQVMRIHELESELKELESSSNLRWNADMRAIKRWREAAPGRELVLPDHADLCVWLLDLLDSSRAALKNTLCRCKCSIHNSDMRIAPAGSDKQRTECQYVHRRALHDPMTEHNECQRQWCDRCKALRLDLAIGSGA
jgi:hypothetical protein